MAGTPTATRKITSGPMQQPAPTVLVQRNIPKICITIDHLHSNNPTEPTSLDIARKLVSTKIPVTVFISCTGSRDGDLTNTCTPIEAQMIKDLVALGPLVTLGIHTLPTFSSDPSVKIATKPEQDANIDYQISIIRQYTGKNPLVASYHGKNAGPDPKIDLASKGVRYVRGIKTEDGGYNNTPIIANDPTKLDICLDSTQANTFFFHSHETEINSNVALIYAKLLAGVREGRYQPVAYYQAMTQRYR